MNPLVRIFLHAMLTQNIVFILFLGALLPMVSGRTVKETFSVGLKLSMAMLFSMLAAVTLSAFLPAEMEKAYAGLVLLLTLLAVRGLQMWGELRGEWGGIPHGVLAYLPLAGSMLLLKDRGWTGLEAIVAAGGIATGYYLALIIITTLMEQIRISEAPPPCKRIGTLLFAFAILALALAGFHFY